MKKYFYHKKEPSIADPPLVDEVKIHRIDGGNYAMSLHISNAYAHKAEFVEHVLGKKIKSENDEIEISVIGLDDMTSLLARIRDEKYELWQNDERLFIAEETAEEIMSAINNIFAESNKGKEKYQKAEEKKTAQKEMAKIKKPAPQKRPRPAPEKKEKKTMGGSGMAVTYITYDSITVQEIGIENSSREMRFVEKDGKWPALAGSVEFKYVKKSPRVKKSELVATFSVPNCSTMEADFLNRFLKKQAVHSEVYYPGEDPFNLKDANFDITGEARIQRFLEKALGQNKDDIYHMPFTNAPRQIMDLCLYVSCHSAFSAIVARNQTPSKAR